MKDKVTEDDIKENIKNVVSELDIIGELDINEENIQVIGELIVSFQGVHMIKPYLFTIYSRKNSSMLGRLPWLP